MRTASVVNRQLRGTKRRGRTILAETLGCQDYVICPIPWEGHGQVLEEDLQQDNGAHEHGTGYCRCGGSDTYSLGGAVKQWMHDVRRCGLGFRHRRVDRESSLSHSCAIHANGKILHSHCRQVSLDPISDIELPCEGAWLWKLVM